MVFRDVHLQLAGARECCSTLRAGCLPCWVVFFLVPSLACQARETSFADGALELLLTVMRLPVAAQITPLEESPLANITCEAAPVRLFVGGQVLFQIARSGKVLATPGTRVASLLDVPVVRHLVAPQTSVLTELPSADGARVQHPVLVPRLMLSQCEPAGEFPFAFAAL